MTISLPVSLFQLCFLDIYGMWSCEVWVIQPQQSRSQAYEAIQLLIPHLKAQKLFVRTFPITPARCFITFQRKIPRRFLWGHFDVNESFSLGDWGDGEIMFFRLVSNKKFLLHEGFQQNILAKQTCPSVITNSGQSVKMFPDIVSPPQWLAHGKLSSL